MHDVHAVSNARSKGDMIKNYRWSSDKAASIIRKPTTWLAVTAMLYGAIQLVSADLGRFLAWDEAVYVSEVSRFTEAVGFAAHRSRGVTLIVAPVLQLTDSMVALRAYLIAVSSALLFFSFLPWSRVIGWAAPVAAGLLASTWLTLFYGSEVMPNLYSALFAVAAVGLEMQYVHAPRRAVIIGMAALVAATGLIRPLDAVALCIAVVAVGVMTRSGRVRSLFSGSAVGFAIGLAPWLVEAWVRFDGPVSRLEGARDIIGGGLTNNFGEYLRLLDGPLSGPSQTPDIDPMVVVWLAVFLVLAVVGLFQEGNRSEVGWVSLVTFLAFAFPYVFASGAAAPRFLLPAIAFLCIGTSLGVARLVPHHRPQPGAIVLTTVMLVLAGWHLSVVDRLGVEQSDARGRALAMAHSLDSISDSGSCFFLSSSGFPQISVATGCRGGRFLTDNLSQNNEVLRVAEESGDAVFVLFNSENPQSLIEPDWRCEYVHNLESLNWHICKPK
jgi:hypothetical protein